MQNFKLKNRMSVSLLLLLTALFVCFNPGYAFADLLGCMQSEAGRGIFKTMACKITTTLFDIRKIVYILGGFGLIAFTFAAIFNKISFKHLANIALSLFLLSMMTPFIEYFTQAPGAKLTYGSFLQPDFTEADYSMTFGECEGGDCPVSTTVAGGAVTGGSSGVGSDGSGGGLGGGLTTGADGRLEPLAPISGVPGGSLASVADTTDIKNIKLDPIATAGTEVDTRTGWQKFKDGIKTVAQEGLKAYNTASSVISAAGSVYDAVDSTVKGVQGADGIGGIITAGVGAFDNFTTATGAITGAAGTIGTNYTDKEGEKGLGEKVDDFFKGKNKGANEGKEVTQDLGTINGTANGIMDIPNDIKNIFR